ncbi:gamma-glutamyltransferase [Aquirhabdus sp.]|uniref:gamma-glutamyltransferase n=1 Tax=Aquirhabdus sp. TaxID=2824160 RepID=UPI00396CD119
MSLYSSQLATSTKAMVTSPHTLASAAGLEVLKAGGNAIEAAIAVATALSVTYPHFNGLGGDAFWVISDQSGAVQTISGIGQAAAQLPDFSGAIPQRGARSALTTAAAVDSWDQAYQISKTQWRGKQSWPSLFNRAIEYASVGFPVTESQHFWQRLRGNVLRDLSGFSETFAPDSGLLNIGERFTQPQLAKSLERIAQYGAREFYEGDLATDIASGLEKAGSPIKLADLVHTHARVESPLRVAYRDGELVSLRPPTQGVTTLQIMGILQRFDMSAIAEGSADYYHLLVEAVKCAFRDRDRLVCDPDFKSVPIDHMLSPAVLDAHARSIHLQHARAWPEVFKHGDTAFIGVCDQEGRCISLLQTIYFDWGSGIVAGDTGILWHNRGASFSTDPLHHNALQSGKRPFHTLNPGMYLKEGRPHLLFGTQGADGQPQTLAAILTRLIDYQMDPYTALARPRFLLGKTFSDTRDALKLEEDAGSSVFAELTARGHEVSAIPAQSQLAGHPGVIRIDADHTLTGAHDPRSNGLAIGL